MRSPIFLENKIKRLLNSNGIEYTFVHMKNDEYNQPIEKENISVLGVYHESNSFITVSSSDAASVQRKKSPMILALMSDEVKKLSQGDEVTINDTLYRVSGILDIQNYCVAADISLEMRV